MKLWLLLSRFELGGLERVQANLAPALARAGLDVWIVAGRFLAGAEAMLPPDVPRLEFARSGRMGFIPGLFSQLKRHRPCVVMTTSNDVACLVLMLRPLLYPEMKVVCTQHLSISGPLNMARGMTKRKLKIIGYFMRRLLPKADAIVAVSQAVSDDVRHTLGLKSVIKVIHNPVVMSEFEEQAAESIQWPWPDRSEPTVVFVGRLVQVKRVDLLVDAFQQVVGRIPARLLIVGDGPERERIHTSIVAKRLEKACRLAGFHSNPLPWIKAADLLVLTSDYEGFGNVLVEAMACGTQIVSTDCPHGPAEILDYGRYGRLVHPGVVDSLANAIVDSLCKDYVSVVDLQRRAGDFTVERAVHAYLSVIFSITGAERCA